MTEWGVIPSIRVQDMAESLAFYRGTLEFTLDSGGDEASNSSLTRGDAHVMIETAADLYGDEYNAAIKERPDDRDVDPGAVLQGSRVSANPRVAPSGDIHAHSRTAATYLQLQDESVALENV